MDWYNILFHYSKLYIDGYSTKVDKTNKVQTTDKLADKFINKTLVNNAQSNKLIGRKIIDEKIKYEIVDQPQATKRLNKMPSHQAREIFNKNNDYVNEVFTSKAISCLKEMAPSISISKQIER